MFERWNEQQRPVDIICEHIKCKNAKLIWRDFCVPLGDVINFENKYFTKQKDLARKWNVSVNEIKAIDDFILHITLNNSVRYYNGDLVEYEKSPISLLKKWQERGRP